MDDDDDDYANYDNLMVISLVEALLSYGQKWPIIFPLFCHQTWTIINCLGLGHETLVSAICISIFLSFEDEKCESHCSMKRPCPPAPSQEIVEYNLIIYHIKFAITWLLRFSALVVGF